MSNVATLIHKPSYLLSLLSSKYSDITEEFTNLNLDCLIFDKPSHLLTLYKEMLYSDHITEFLKRFYTNEESNDRVPRLAIYYKNYHIFFCRPVFTSSKITILMHHYGDKKAEMFYKNNYGNGEERHSESQCQSSDTSISSLNNNTDIKTIFNKTTRNQIDLNTMVFNNTNITNSIQGSELYTKRSTNDSLRNILVTMKVIKPHNDKRHNRNYKQQNGLSLKGSSCTLTKTKTKENSNSSEMNKFLLSPKYKPYLSNFKSNLIEFKKSKPEIFNSNNINGNFTMTNNKLMITSTRIPLSSNKYLSHKTSISKLKGINNNTYDSNNVLLQPNQKKTMQNTITNTIRNNPNGVNMNFIQSTSTKSKSCKNTIAHIINELGKKSSTYTTFVINSKNKQKDNKNANNNHQSQRSTSNTSKNNPIASSSGAGAGTGAGAGKVNTITFNNSNSNNNLKNNYNTANQSNHKPKTKTNPAIHCNSGSRAHTNTTTNPNTYTTRLNPTTRNHSNNNANHNTDNHSTNNLKTNSHHTKIATSLKKNKVQIYMNYNSGVSRNKKNESYSTTFSKNKTQMTNQNNCLGLTTTGRGNTSIDTRETKRTQLKSILHELAKGGENQSHLAKKLDQLIKGSTSEWIRKKRQEDEIRRQNSRKENYNSNNNNSNSSNTKRNISNRGNSTSKSEHFHPNRIISKASEIHIQVNTRQPSLNSPHNRNLSRKLSP